MKKKLTYDNNNEGSCGHHAILNNPWLCPTNVANGTVVLALQSHNFITGLRSSPDAVIICKPSVGFHATSDTIAPGVLSQRSSHHNFPDFISYIATIPFEHADAKMCDTCVFHDNYRYRMCTTWYM